jgi:hypothetical protein
MLPEARTRFSIARFPHGRFVDCLSAVGQKESVRLTTNIMSSATDRTTASFEVGAVAHVNFRARCESLGHGEEVFLVAEEDKGRTKVGVVSCRADGQSRALTRRSQYWKDLISGCDPGMFGCGCYASVVSALVWFQSYIISPRHSRLLTEGESVDSSGPNVLLLHV